MPVKILMPALSPTMTQGNLVRWLKAEGDVIKAGQVLAEIETDKATMEVEAVEEGILAKIIVPSGTEGVAVNSLIALLWEEGETPSHGEELTQEITFKTVSQSTLPPLSTRESTAPSTIIKDQNRVFASPLARRIAHLNQIDLHTIQGTGPYGRIIKRDVDTVVGVSLEETTETQTIPCEDKGYIDVPLNNLRKVIARRLTESKQQVPHFYLNVDCELDGLLKLRAELNQRLQKGKLSVNDFIVRACALALIKVPEANVAWGDTHLRHFQAADISVAVAIEGGLVTPIIRSANLKTLQDISTEMKILVEKARSGKLLPEDYQGGNFTISNLGMYGVKQFNAIINPPQACILAIGAGEERVIVKGGEIKIATMMSCTLSADHRAVDGAVGARFLEAFKKLIEDPLSLLL